MALEDGLIIPGTVTDELLHGTNGIWVNAAQGLHYEFNGCSGHAQEPAAQILTRPVTLFATLGQGAVNGVIGLQVVNQLVHISGAKVHH
ncbi:hypothetical protein C2W62_08975 [Candidatus Entotheonella serta]|nr:hypothetical protein C2W62_08975 [Candidatus Entotheonella serta]